jgi:hypothetical protein
MRRRALLALFGAALIGVAIAGCTRVRVTYHSDPDWKHKGLQTYTWKPLRGFHGLSCSLNDGRVAGWLISYRPPRCRLAPCVPV